ncbi:uncharacterized protein EAF01_011587 [Botrytis porri]|uniref:Stress response protein rds1p n=1 Tax=Botrytis porri TaxID=87229 RepID=A0A4Z1KHI3_9HELO|nr:uncharacterized protein EAF01_011587 [Botrytis porri]KAF7884164.1 hypothetical protein EAF01_011587 [Botrytis porri]TGO83712.1 hypothetical protein BPOR_0603g00020 [Botrytis porri]
MQFKFVFLSILVSITLSVAHPASLNISDPSDGPIPSETNYYSSYRGKSAPFPANSSSPILPTGSGPPGPDDLLFQNLLGAEWAVFSFYQQAVEALNTTSFTTIGFPNNTYDRIQEIRDNEAGHLRIFQDSISNTSIKPGACDYDFGWSTATEFLEMQVLIEVSSMVFAAGLVQQANLNVTKGALMGIGETETRHTTWALISVWGVDPFAGPIDTSFPYANQILDSTNRFIIDESCPRANPGYPSPSQHLPQLQTPENVTAGGNLTFVYEKGSNGIEMPIFEEGKNYYAVFFHGLEILSVPYDVTSHSTIFPADLELKGIILAVIADELDAPTEESVVAGPAFILEQPAILVDSGI